MRTPVNTALRRVAAAALAAVAATGAAVGLAAAPAAAAASCADYLPGAGHPGFANTNVPYTATSPFLRVGGSRVMVHLFGARNCDAPGSRFVYAEARLWDATGRVHAYVEQYGAGVVPGVAAVVDPSGFFTPASTPMKNVAGLTVRACAAFGVGTVLEGRCGSWVAVPA